MITAVLILYDYSKGLSVYTHILEYVHLRKTTQLIIGFVNSEEGRLQYMIMTAVDSAKEPFSNLKTRF